MTDVSDDSPPAELDDLSLRGSATEMRSGGSDVDMPPNNYSSSTMQGAVRSDLSLSEEAIPISRVGGPIDDNDVHRLNGGHKHYNNALPTTSMEGKVENSERIANSSALDSTNTIGRDFSDVHGNEIASIENGIKETPFSEMKQSSASSCVDVKGVPGGKTEPILELNKDEESDNGKSSDIGSGVDCGNFCSEEQEGEDHSLDDTLRGGVGKPHHKGAATQGLKTGASDGNAGKYQSAALIIQDEMTHPPKVTQFIPSKTATPSETTSLLNRGMSLFSKGSRQFRPARYENDANSVISEMTQDVKSVSKLDNNDDDALRRHLEESGLVLLKRLIEFLSECPPASDEGTENHSLSEQSMTKNPKKRHRGLTLPASAIGWLSTQIYDSGNDGLTNLGDCYRVPKQQLRCIGMLFKRVTSLRISGEAWPPPTSAPGKAAGDLVNSAKKSFATNLFSKFSGDPSMPGDGADDASCETTTTVPSQISVSPFRRYYHELQSCPRVDMSFFPNATKVVLDGIPPNWVTNLDSLKILEMFQYEKGCILDINQLFFPSDIIDANPRNCLGLVNRHGLSLNEEGGGRINDSLESSSHVVYFSLSKLRLSHCAMGETAGLRGRRAVPRLPTFSRFPNLVSLNISHNELFKTKTVLAGLSSLSQLSSLNLSYNRLSSLDDIFMHLGNVTELLLTGNAITSTRGLDRIFSLERLTLDENKISQLTHIVGLANLPFLMTLDLKGNPFEIDDPASSRVKVFNLFREVRCSNLPKDATFRDMQCLLPVLDKELATKEELVALKDLTFRTTVITMDSRPTGKDGDTDANGIDDKSEISILMPDPREGRRRIVKSSQTTLAHLRMTGSTSSNEKQAGRGRWLERCQGEVVGIQFNMNDLITSIRPEFDVRDSYIVGEREWTRARSYSSQKSECKDKNAVESLLVNFPFGLPPALLAEADDDTWNPAQIIPSDTFVWDELSVEDRIDQDFDGGETGTHSYFPLLGDGQVQKSKDEGDSVGNDSDQADGGFADKSRKSMFSGIWEQPYRDNVAKPALDVIDSTETITPESLDFNAIEENSQFDGNPVLGPLFVSSDLDLYFDSFVFPRDSDEDEKQDTISRGESLAPRIGLFKFDRGLLINYLRQQANYSSSIDFRERYVGVCKEYVLACGPYARTRLSPIKTPKRTFHGDTVIRAGKDVMISESRKFILCLSESALYFIIDDDITSQKPTGSKRSFPSRIPPNATFRDAYWPHALIRHPLDCLRGITIGFQFQRLILRFSISNATTSSSLEYTYVIITANKSHTVSLLQRINDPQLGMGALIGNDDKTFLDALGALGSNEVVLHYQILRQCWRRGDRESPMRSFVLTDLKVYLIDETYNGDGTEPEEDKGNMKKLGDVSLAIIDSAKLSRVTEVRAANEDPRKITLVVLPQNKLKRSHRWRLICNDGEGAERLIDAVRKAIDVMA